MNSLNMDGYRDRLNAYKKTGNEGEIARMKSSIVSGFYKTPSYFKVNVDSEERDVHIVEGFEENSLIMMKPGETISAGSLVEWQDRNYMVVLIYDNRTIQYKGVLERCNEILTWQDKDNVNYNMPCMLADKTSVYSDGLSKTKFITIGSDQISIMVQKNKDTDNIPLGKRLIFRHDKNNIYKVARIDNMLNEGLLTFVCKKSLYNEHTDNLELNLANYNNVGIENPSPDNKGLKITGQNIITIWDYEVEYMVNTTEPVKWSINNDNLIEISEIVDNNLCLITPVSTRDIGETILRVELLSDSSKYAEIKIKLAYQ